MIAHKLAEDPSYHTVVTKDKQRFWKRILIVDDDADVTITFKAAIEESNNYKDANKSIEVHTSNNPVIALSEFKPNFYDLLLVDINMPNINGLNYVKRSISMSNFVSCLVEALRGIYPISLGCFIRKPVTMDYLLKRIMSELD